ncbi:putative membrane protein [Mycoplasma suis str. Illinois]|uniref:Putative membrane protein n=1 Tax=Mycoplasma suis (strain Illinois) TaxID=768700 RepID=F0QQ18_MYCSL|nr:putative membrane protein [Mycoplasma suis str. Illinois]
MSFNYFSIPTISFLIFFFPYSRIFSFISVSLSGRNLTIIKWCFR